MTPIDCVACGRPVAGYEPEVCCFGVPMHALEYACGCRGEPVNGDPLHQGCWPAGGYTGPRAPLARGFFNERRPETAGRDVPLLVRGGLV